jgi:hypothetical protein
MKPLVPRVAAVLLLAASPSVALPVQTATFHFTGRLDTHHGVIRLPFTLGEDADDFRLWTDSYLDGLNFDPLVALWTEDGALIHWNDDDADIHPASQSFADAGFALGGLLAGHYLLTLTLSENTPLGNFLADGFRYDGDSPVALSAGRNWSVWLTASQGSGSVPEPALLSLFGAGALAAACAGRRPKTR